MVRSRKLFDVRETARVLSALLWLLLFVACKQKASDKTVGSEEKTIERTEERAITEEVPKHIAPVLFEDHIGTVPLPFPRKDMLPILQEAFKPLSVTREMGQQDGPDFPLYSVKGPSGEVAYFSMDYEDTLALVEIRIKKGLITDAYGLHVGDRFSEINNRRTGELHTYTDYHGHTYTSIENSHIGYEIYDTIVPLNAPDKAVDEISDSIGAHWKINTIIWSASSDR